MCLAILAGMPHPDVVTVGEARMGLLALVLARLLRHRLEDPRARRHARRVSGDVAVIASGMRVTLRFEDGHIVVHSGAPTGRPRASLRGKLHALVAAANGRGLLRSLLCGDLRFWGGLTTLWHLFAVLVCRPRERTSPALGGRVSAPGLGHTQDVRGEA
jgi:hypothetical protein